MIEQQRITPNPQVQPLSQKDARSLVLKVNQCATDAKQYLLELHDREGWKVLGYPSFRAFVEGEIKLSREHAYKLLDAARVHQHLSQNYYTEEIPDSHACVLKKVPEDKRIEIYETAKSTSDGKPTAKHVRETAEDAGAMPPKWGARDKGQSADWGRGKSGRYELEQKLKTFSKEQKELYLLSCAYQLGHSARWEVACEVERAKDVQAATERLRKETGLI